MNQALAYDRQPIGHCANCRRPSAPYAYLQDGRHYCAPCARTAVTRGSRRNGGSYTERFNNVAVWNTVMNSYEYSLVRWYELLSS